MKGYAIYKDMMFALLLSLVVPCGLPVGTLKLTPPALTTCDGASLKLVSISRCCHTCMYARHMLCVER
jgi:hypothetical protein